MLTENSVIAMFFEAIALSLSISIIAKNLLKNSWMEFLIYNVLLLAACFVCISVYPTTYSLVAMLLLSVLSYYKSKNYLYSYYISTICIIFIIFINYLCTLGYQFITPNQKLILAFPLVLHIQIIVLSILVSMFLLKADLSLKSASNMIVQSLYNTIFLVFYLIVTPMTYTYNDYFNTLLYTLILVIFISNIIMSFFIKNNESKILIAEADHKYLDYKKQTSMKQYHEAIIIKHNFAYRYHALSYYIMKNDMEGLNNYFNEYMVPIQNAHESNERVMADLENISEDTLRNSLFILYNQCCIYGIHLRLNVSLKSKEVSPDISDIDLITIMGIFCEIALYQANRFKKSGISVFIENEGDMIRIALENGCQGEEWIEDVNNQFPDEIQIIDEVIKKYRNVKIDFLHHKNQFIQELIIAKGNVL